jgi:DsbC/DsbD-like thiol-disulfide interchange protein
MRRHLAVLSLGAALSAAPGIARAIEVVTVQPPPGVEVKPGAGTRIAIQVTVKPGYHVQANPVENPDLIPITLKLDAAGSVSVGDPVYPAAKRMRLPGDSQDLVVYDGTFAIFLPVKVGRDAVGGETVTLRGTLRYQACDDRHCLFPVTLPVALVVTIRKR